LSQLKKFCSQAALLTKYIQSIAKNSKSVTSKSHVSVPLTSKLLIFAGLAGEPHHHICGPDTNW